MPLHPCTFHEVIAHEKVVMISALNNNKDLQRFLFLYVSGNYSRLLSSINRSSKNFEVRRAYTAYQLFTILKETNHTILLLEHDPTLFDSAEEMLPQIAGMLKDIGRESLVIVLCSVCRPLILCVNAASRSHHRDYTNRRLNGDNAVS